MRWLRKAADQAYAPAQSLLGLAYYRGRGVAKDNVEAYAWLNLAAPTYAQAASDRDVLAGMLSPDQLVAGFKRTKELRAQIEARLQSIDK